MENTPRRIRMDKWTAAEKAIHNAIQIIEEMGADVKLTSAVTKLSEAQNDVADYVDGKLAQVDDILATLGKALDKG